MTGAIPATSLAAYHSLSVGSLREEILSFIESAGKTGVISDDVFEYLSKPGRNDSSITTRYSELERAGLIYRAGDTRPGKSGRQQMIMRSIKYAECIPVIPKRRKREGKRNPFVEGMIFAAKTILKESDFTSAKRALKTELEKVLAK